MTDQGEVLTPLEMLESAVHATPVDMAVARTAMTGFAIAFSGATEEVRLQLADKAGELVDLGAKRLDHSGEVDARGELLALISPYQIIAEGIAKAGKPAKAPTKTRRRRMTGAKG
jgi:hypothetical protein